MLYRVVADGGVTSVVALVDNSTVCVRACACVCACPCVRACVCDWLLHHVVLSALCHRYNIEQEEKLATETTVLMESYTVSWCSHMCP